MPCGRVSSPPPSPLTCPDCDGALWEIKDQNVRYRCHVGHGFWSALRAIEEAIKLRTRMMAQAKNRHLTGFTAALEREIADRKRRADALREVLIGPTRQKRPRPAARRKRQAHG